jgi:quercetin dioxygenase-like cupin family protein
MPLEVFDARRDIRNLVITPEIRNRIMRVMPGQTTPGHTHDLGHETFLVLDGRAEFTIDGQSAILGPGQLCWARAGQWHTVRCVGDAPMTMYLSVTPHIEPTHTHWDREGGTRLPYRYGEATRAERQAGPQARTPVEALLDQHLAASQALARSAAANASAQQAAAGQLRAALEQHDQAGARRALDPMWEAFYLLHRQLREAEETWNELAARAGGE